MNTKLYTQIQENKSASFETLYKNNSQEFPTKAELGAQLKLLEQEKKIFQFAGNYYDLSQFETIEGYVQWNMTGFCWLSQTNNMNEYGLTFNPDDNLLSIFTKRDAFYGAYVQGKKVQVEDREFVYITNTYPEKGHENSVKIIATYQASKDEWVILNSGMNFTFKQKTDELTQPEAGEVALFEVQINEKQHRQFKQLEVLGNMQDFGMESKLIALLGGIKTAPEASFEHVQSAKIPTVEKAFFTIDSLHTKDIDDAIYVETTQSGYRLFVAIADVSSYVLPGDKQDEHAAQVCSSFYLPQNTIHMLDGKLAENFCSLNPGAAKQAMVCEMEFDLSGKMLSKEFYQANILSHARLTYEDVDRLLAGVAPQESTIYKQGVLQPFRSLAEMPELVESLNLLAQFAKTQERQRPRDYFVVEQPEFHLGENGKIDYLYMREENALSQKVVETSMLAANIAAAEFIFERYPTFGMFRNQVQPEAGDFPKPAYYHSDNEGHWGLQTEFYTHFTSPIRRYCDLLVHRIIKNILSAEKEHKPYDYEQLSQIAKQINLQQYKAKQYAIKAKNLLLPQYIETLHQQGQLDMNLTVVDFSRDGVVVKNQQLLEFYIPAFKLERDVVKSIDKILPQDEDTMSLETKLQSILQMNNQWKFHMKMLDYTWTDERRNALYQAQRLSPAPQRHKRY